jgi:hypothetical protein
MQQAQFKIFSNEVETKNHFNVTFANTGIFSNTCIPDSLSTLKFNNIFINYDHCPQNDDYKHFGFWKIGINSYCIIERKIFDYSDITRYYVNVYQKRDQDWLLLKYNRLCLIDDDLLQSTHFREFYKIYSSIQDDTGNIYIIGVNIHFVLCILKIYMTEENTILNEQQINLDFLREIRYSEMLLPEKSLKLDSYEIRYNQIEKELFVFSYKCNTISLKTPFDKVIVANYKYKKDYDIKKISLSKKEGNIYYYDYKLGDSSTIGEDVSPIWVTKNNIIVFNACLNKLLILNKDTAQKEREIDNIVDSSIIKNISYANCQCELKILGFGCLNPTEYILLYRFDLMKKTGDNDDKSFLCKTFSTTVKINLTWNIIRLLFISFYKEDRNTCNLALLPKEMIRDIISLLESNTTF